MEFKTRFKSIKLLTFNIYNNLCNDLFGGFKIKKTINK